MWCHRGPAPPWHHPGTSDVSGRTCCPSRRALSWGHILAHPFPKSAGGFLAASDFKVVEVME